MNYLDYAATTPLDPRVLDAMLPFFHETFGNPSSIHRFGQRAEAAVEESRATVAECLGCEPGEIVFTSCGSESDNLALRGAAFALREIHGAARILTSQTEHHAVSKTASALHEQEGMTVGWLDVDEYGRVSPLVLEGALPDGNSIVSVMYANNEIGTINPVRDLAQVCRRHGALFHTDAVQAAAYLPVQVNELGADLISLGGHKFYGPKGIGALYVRQGTSLHPQVTGGGQEFGLRAGTSNVAYIVGFAAALRLAVEERSLRTAHVRPLRDRIVQTVLEIIPEACLTGHPEIRLPNHASFAFKDVDGNSLLQLLDNAGFACSSGSACKTGNPEPSEVLSAIGLPREWSLGSLRVTLGIGATGEQVEEFLALLPRLVEKARALHQG
jgi:cysteine desulfurase